MFRRRTLAVSNTNNTPHKPPPKPKLYKPTFIDPLTQAILFSSYELADAEGMFLTDLASSLATTLHTNDGLNHFARWLFLSAYPSISISKFTPIRSYPLAAFLERDMEYAQEHNLVPRFHYPFTANDVPFKIDHGLSIPSYVKHNIILSPLMYKTSAFEELLEEPQWSTQKHNTSPTFFFQQRFEVFSSLILAYLPLGFFLVRIWTHLESLRLSLEELQHEYQLYTRHFPQHLHQMLLPNVKPQSQSTTTATIQSANGQHSRQVSSGDLLLNDDGGFGMIPQRGRATATAGTKTTPTSSSSSQQQQQQPQQQSQQQSQQQTHQKKQQQIQSYLHLSELYIQFNLKLNTVLNDIYTWFCRNTMLVQLLDTPAIDFLELYFDLHPLAKPSDQLSTHSAGFTPPSRLGSFNSTNQQPSPVSRQYSLQMRPLSGRMSINSPNNSLSQRRPRSPSLARSNSPRRDHSQPRSSLSSDTQLRGSGSIGIGLKPRNNTEVKGIDGDNNDNSNISKIMIGHNTTKPRKNTVTDNSPISPDMESFLLNDFETDGDENGATGGGKLTPAGLKMPKSAGHDDIHHLDNEQYQDEEDDSSDNDDDDDDDSIENGNDLDDHLSMSSYEPIVNHLHDTSNDLPAPPAIREVYNLLYLALPIHPTLLPTQEQATTPQNASGQKSGVSSIFSRAKLSTPSNQTPPPPSSPPPPITQPDSYEQLTDMTNVNPNPCFINFTQMSDLVSILLTLQLEAFSALIPLHQFWTMFAQHFISAVHHNRVYEYIDINDHFYGLVMNSDTYLNKTSNQNNATVAYTLQISRIQQLQQQQQQQQQQLQKQQQQLQQQQHQQQPLQHSGSNVPHPLTLHQSQTTLTQHLSHSLAHSSNIFPQSPTTPLTASTPNHFSANLTSGSGGGTPTQHPHSQLFNSSPSHPSSHQSSSLLRSFSPRVHTTSLIPPPHTPTHHNNHSLIASSPIQPFSTQTSTTSSQPMGEQHIPLSPVPSTHSLTETAINPFATPIIPNSQPAILTTTTRRIGRLDLPHWFNVEQQFKSEILNYFYIPPPFELSPIRALSMLLKHAPIIPTSSGGSSNNQFLLSKNRTSAPIPQLPIPPPATAKIGTQRLLQNTNADPSLIIPSISASSSTTVPSLLSTASTIPTTPVKPLTIQQPHNNQNQHTQNKQTPLESILPQLELTDPLLAQEIRDTPITIHSHESLACYKLEQYNLSWQSQALSLLPNAPLHNQPGQSSQVRGASSSPNTRGVTGPNNNTLSKYSLLDLQSDSLDLVLVLPTQSTRPNDGGGIFSL